MKTLNLVICLLAVTISVACSKKKDGNSNQGQYPYGVTPNEQIYNHGNGYINGGYQQMPGYHMNPQMNCQGPSAMYPTLTAYCGFLATEGERVCNPVMARQLFMQQCQAFATQLNYCVEQVRTVRCGSVGCSYKVRDKWERYSHASTRDRDTGTWVKKPTNPGIIPPVVVTPGSCKPQPDVDCKKISPKKPKLHCKLPEDSNDESNYLYSYDDYMVLACKNGGGVAKATAEQRAAVAQPSNRAYVTPKSDVGTSSNVQGGVVGTIANKPLNPSVNNTECLNIQDVHEFIIDQKNGISSSAEFFQAELLNKSVSKQFVAEWKKSIAKRLEIYSTPSGTEYSQWSAIGAHLSQSKDTFILNKVADFGQIVNCANGKEMSAQFNNEVGVQSISYSSNYSVEDLRKYKSDDFEVIETIRGTFKMGNESSSYILARYIGIGKKLSTSKVQAKIVQDMKNKKFPELVIQ